MAFHATMRISNAGSAFLRLAARYNSSAALDEPIQRRLFF